MKRPFLHVAAALMMMPMLGGCVAAVVPAIAAGALTKSQIGDKGGQSDMQGNDRAASSVGATHGVPVQNQALPSDAAAIIAAEEDRIRSSHFGPSQHRAGPFDEFSQFAETQAKKRASGNSISSAVLIPDVDIENPETMPCGQKPLAVIIDIDEGVDADSDAALGFRAQDGLADALRQMRSDRIRIIWLSDRPVARQSETRAMLDFLGITAPSDLFLFDDGESDRKQLRRQKAAQDNCVLAIAGDEYADFDELYDYTLYPEVTASLDGKFGKGWFVTPQPLIALKPSAAGAQR